MRKMFIFAALFFTSLCYADTLRVSAVNGKIQFDICLENMPLFVERIEMRRSLREAPGFISFTLKSDLSQERMDDYKRVVFERGSDLPSLSDGVYDLVINDVYSGQLFVEPNGVDIQP